MPRSKEPRSRRSLPWRGPSRILKTLWCSAGVSRSPTIAIAVLHKLKGYPVVEAFRTVLSRVHLAQSRAVTWPSLCRFYGQIVTPADVRGQTPTVRR